ncbi:MAG: phosphoglycerate kinase, partial [Acidobacteria bacterium]|nr:phosphoglycerate kinase [Acidobacteriota bacterium]
ALPTITYALTQGATVILASHLGRPKGKVNHEFTLKPVADHLAKLLGRSVAFASDCVGAPAQEAIAANPGGVILLENLRFHAEEEANDPAFAKQLASLCDVYVNDAFGSAHRAHASTEGIVHHVADAVAGFLMADEVEYLGKALNNPDRPFVAILGGAKVSDKLEVIENLLGKVDALLIGGAMAYTFFKARGIPVGRSLVEDDLVETARALEARARAQHVQLELPVDHVVAPKLEAGAPTQLLAVGDTSIGDRMGLDIGPKTVALYRSVIGSAKTVVWNGPMGVFEIEAFAAGTMGVAQAVAAVHGTTIIGGGDSVAAVTRAGVADKMTHISTGGGASLEFLGGQTLPGVAALQQK